MPSYVASSRFSTNCDHAAADSQTPTGPTPKV
jgi:hypothetical protein